MIVQFVGLNTA